MRTVEDLYARAFSCNWENRNAVTLLREKIDNLTDAGRISSKDSLSDEVLELIIQALRSDPEKVEDSNSLRSLDVILNRMKSGIVPNVVLGEFLYIDNYSGSYGVLTPYPTTVFSAESGGMILSSQRRYAPGYLGFLFSTYVKEGMFEPITAESANSMWSSAWSFEPATAHLKKVRGILEVATSKLESGNPPFSEVPGNCSPVPNFLQSSNWPMISEMIKKWLVENSLPES